MTSDGWDSGIVPKYYNLVPEKNWEADLAHLEEQIDDKCASELSPFVHNFSSSLSVSPPHFSPSVPFLTLPPTSFLLSLFPLFPLFLLFFISFCHSIPFCHSILF
tara:strand:- start:268 stop:582 length:315 start_codon:yes stop_codon:yes gene_type:complete